MPKENTGYGPVPPPQLYLPSRAPGDRLREREHTRQTKRQTDRRTETDPCESGVVAGEEEREEEERRAGHQAEGTDKRISF